MEDLDENTSIWEKLCPPATLQAAVHLGIDYVENLHSTENQLKRTLKQLFNVTGKLIRDQKEIQGKSVINWQPQTWQKTTLHLDKAVQLSTAKTYVFSDSVLCMGRISENPVKAWKEKIDWFQFSLQYRELDRIDGEPMEFEWKKTPGFTALQILAEVQKDDD